MFLFVVITLFTVLFKTAFGRIPFPGQCEPLNLKQCEHMPYNLTMMPNLLGHRSQEEAHVNLQEFQDWLDTECSRHLKSFICNLYAPVCTFLKQPIPPCRHVCKEVERECWPKMQLHFKRAWRKQIKCSQLPEFGLCISSGTRKQDTVTTSPESLKKIKTTDTSDDTEIREKDSTNEANQGEENNYVSSIVSGNNSRVDRESENNITMSSDVRGRIDILNGQINVSTDVRANSTGTEGENGINHISSDDNRIGSSRNPPALPPKQPVFDDQMMNVTVQEKMIAVLPCSFPDLGNHKVVWTDERSTLLSYEERRIIDDDRISIERPFKKDWNLHIRDVKRSDQGEYTCQINTNPVTMKKVFLHVLAPPPKQPEFDDHMMNVTVEEKMTAVLPCSFPDLGNHKVVWTDEWSTLLSLNDRRIIDDERITIERPFYKDWNLHIRDVKRSDQGEYKCQINTNPLTMKTVFLHVLVPAKNTFLDNQTVNVTVEEKMTAVLPCSVTNLDKHGVIWLNPLLTVVTFRELRLIDDQRISIERPYFKAWNLHIKNITLEDHGLYKCIINTKPPQTQTVILNVLERDDAVQSFRVIKRLPNRITLSWQKPKREDVSSYVLRYYGTRTYNEDGQIKNITHEQEEIKIPVNQTTYTTKNLLPKMRFIFNISAIFRDGKEEGISQHIAAETLAEMPPAPEKVTVRRTSGSTMTVMWDKPDLPVSGYRIFYNMFATPSMYTWQQEEFGSYNVVEIGGLEPNTVYAVRVQVKSLDGRYGNMSEVVTANLREMIAERPVVYESVQRFRVIQRLPNSITLSWQKPKREDVSSYILRYSGRKRYNEEGQMKNITHEQEEMTIPASQTTHTVRNLQPKMIFIFKISPIFRDGKEEGMSQHIAAETRAEITPAPKNVKVLQTSGSTMKVMWDEPDLPVSGYKIFYNTFATPSMYMWQQEEFGPNNVTEIGGLEPNTVYTVRVQAKSLDGRYGNMSEVVTANMREMKPSVTTTFAPQDIIERENVIPYWVKQKKHRCDIGFHKCKDPCNRAIINGQIFCCPTGKLITYRKRKARVVCVCKNPKNRTTRE